MLFRQNLKRFRQDLKRGRQKRQSSTRRAWRRFVPFFLYISPKSRTFAEKLREHVLHRHHHRHDDLSDHRHLASHRHQDRIPLGHASLDHLPIHRHWLLRVSALHREHLHIVLPGCLRSLCPVGYRLTLRPEATRGEGLVPHEPQASPGVQRRLTPKASPVALPVRRGRAGWQAGCSGRRCRR